MADDQLLTSTQQVIASECASLGRVMQRHPIFWAWQDAPSGGLGFNTPLQTAYALAERVEGLFDEVGRAGGLATSYGLEIAMEVLIVILALRLAVRQEKGQRWTIRDEVGSLCELLLTKNKRYGNSALTPCRLFAKASANEQIAVRIDDKVSRIRAMGGVLQVARAQTADEDTLRDLAGYLVLWRVGQVGLRHFLPPPRQDGVVCSDGPNAAEAGCLKG